MKAVQTICALLIAASFPSIAFADEPAVAEDAVVEGAAEDTTADDARREAVRRSIESGERTLLRTLGTPDSGSSAMLEKLLMDAPPAEKRHQLSLLGLGRIDGQLARVDCREDEIVSDEDLYYARQTAYLRTLREQTASAGQTEPIATNVGNSVFPGPIGRYLLSQSQLGANDLVRVLGQIPYVGHALGSQELGIPRAELLAFTQASGELDLPLQAANLRCAEFGGAEAICVAVGTGPGQQPFQVVERGELKIAFTTVLDPVILERIAAERAAGLELLDPAEVLKTLIPQMRAEADIVVVQFHLTSTDPVPKAYRLAGEVAGIDVLLTNRLLERHDTKSDEPAPDARSAGYLVAPDTGTFIVSANSGAHSVATVELDVAGEPGEPGATTWSVRGVKPRWVSTQEVQPDEDTATQLREIARAYCAQWGEPIAADAPLVQAFELQDLQRFILNVMRFSTRSELAVVNSQALHEQSQFPIRDQLTRADVYTSLPYNNPLVTVHVTGKTLRSLAPRLGTALIAAGLEVRDDAVLINGRPPIDERLYRVATNQFLASGGDGIFAADQLRNVRTFHPQWSEEPPTIANTVIHFVESRQYTRMGAVDDALSPDGNFPDLYRKFLWMFTGSLNASYNQVAVTNPVVDDAPAYDQSRLTVQPTDQINLEGRFGVRADSRNHGWDNDLTVQFATARIGDDPDNSEFEETKDLIRFRSQYRYQRLRADLGGRWYVPNPMAEYQLETEFDAPDERDWHRLDMRAILGVTFLLAAPLEIKIGGNARQDINDPDGEATLGLNAGYKLRRISLVNLLGRPIQFESELEFFFNDLGNDNIQELRNENRLFFAISESFFFTTTFNAYMFRTDPVGEFGTNTELTVGLNYLWETSAQTF